MKIKVINKIDKKQKKYDIQIQKNHNYFANGILVHNCNIYPDRIHARSLDSANHKSRHWVKGLWGSIKRDIPDGWRICGENMYAKHSIFYDKLESYFLVYKIWNEYNYCLSWDDTLIICDALNLKTVPVIKEMKFDESYLRELPNKLDLTKQEGFVFRNFESFHYDDFSENVCKWVRAGHVQSSTHWMFDEIIQNKLKQ
jgi:hypothetical protein